MFFHDLVLTHPDHSGTAIAIKKEKASSPPATAAKDLSREETEIISGLEIITRQGVIAEIVNEFVFRASGWGDSPGATHKTA